MQAERRSTLHKAIGRIGVISHRAQEYVRAQPTELNVEQLKTLSLNDRVLYLDGMIEKIGKITQAVSDEEAEKYAQDNGVDEKLSTLSSVLRVKLPYAGNPLWQRLDLGELEWLLFQAHNCLEKAEFLDVAMYQLHRTKSDTDDFRGYDYFHCIYFPEIKKLAQYDPYQISEDTQKYKESIEKEPFHCGDCCYECCSCVKCCVEAALGIDTSPIRAGAAHYLYGLGDCATVDQAIEKLGNAPKPEKEQHLQDAFHHEGRRNMTTAEIWAAGKYTAAEALQLYKKDPMSFFIGFDE